MLSRLLSLAVASAASVSLMATGLDVANAASSTVTSTGGNYAANVVVGGVSDSGLLSSSGQLLAKRVSVGAKGTVAVALTPDGSGSWVLNQSGHIDVYGGAAAIGNVSLPKGDLASVLTGSSSGQGGWVADRNGVVFALGDATPLTLAKYSVPSVHPVAILPSGTGKGLSVVFSDGHVQRAGDAVAVKSLAVRTNDVVSATLAGNNIWLISRTGQATLVGPSGVVKTLSGLSGIGKNPVIGGAPTADGLGLWLVRADGSIISRGSAALIHRLARLRGSKTYVTAAINTGGSLIPATTKVIPAAVAASASLSDAGQITLPRVDLPTLKVGDIIVLPPSPSFSGAVRTLSSIQLKGSTAQLQTAAASLTDAFPGLVAESSVDINPSTATAAVPWVTLGSSTVAGTASARATSTPAATARATAAASPSGTSFSVNAVVCRAGSAKPSLQAGPCPAGEETVAAVEGHATASLNPHQKLDLGFSPSYEVSLNAHIGGDLHLSVYPSAQSTGSWELSVPVVSFLPNKGKIGPFDSIGVEVDAGISVDVGVDANGRVTFEGGVSFTRDISGGAKFGTKGPSLNGTQTGTVSTSGPGLGVELNDLNADVTYGFDASYLIEGVAGASATLGPGISANRVQERSPNWQWFLVVKFGTEVNFNALGKLSELLHGITFGPTGELVNVPGFPVYVPLSLCTDASGCGLLQVDGPPDITGTVGTRFSLQLKSRGGVDPLKWTLVNGGFPDGVSLDPDTGLISGTPREATQTVGEIEVRDKRNEIGYYAFTFTTTDPNKPFTITNTSLPDAIVGIPYHAGMLVDYGPLPYTYRILAGTLPPGISLSGDGVFSGQTDTPAKTAITVEATDALGEIATKTFDFIVETALPPPATGTPIFIGAPDPAASVASSWGDPHLVTFDGATYDFQQIGEFTALRSTTDDMEVQVRQQPYQGSRVVAANVATAMKVSGHRVGIYVTDSGVRTTLDGSGLDVGALPTALPGGGSVVLNAEGRRETVTWPDGSYVAADYQPGSHLSLSAGLASARLGKVKGLLGDADGSPANDLISAGGKILPYPSQTTADLYGDYANNWRVTSATSLFDYAAGETTAFFTDRNFPYAQLTIDQLPSANRDAAQQICASAGVTDQAILNGCILDVAISGNAQLAAGAATAQSVSSPADDSIIAHSAAGDAWTSPDGSSGRAVLTYHHIGCTAVNAAGQCTGGSWAVVPGAPVIWRTQLTESGQDVATFTKTFNVSADDAGQAVTLTAWADDVFTATLNGDPVLSGSIGGGPAATPVTLKPGTNTITFTVTNNSGYDPQGNPAGLAWKLAAS